MHGRGDTIDGQHHHGVPLMNSCVKLNVKGTKADRVSVRRPCLGSGGGVKKKSAGGCGTKANGCAGRQRGIDGEGKEIGGSERATPIAAAVTGMMHTGGTAGTSGSDDSPQPRSLSRHPGSPAPCRGSVVTMPTSYPSGRDIPTGERSTLFHPASCVSSPRGELLVT